MHFLSSILGLLMEWQAALSLGYVPKICSNMDPAEYSFHLFVAVSI